MLDACPAVKLQKVYDMVSSDTVGAHPLAIGA